MVKNRLRSDHTVEMVYLILFLSVLQRRCIFSLQRAVKDWGQVSGPVDNPQVMITSLDAIFLREENGLSVHLTILEHHTSNKKELGETQFANIQDTQPTCSSSTLSGTFQYVKVLCRYTFSWELNDC